MEILLNDKIDSLPSELDSYNLKLDESGRILVYSYNSNIDSSTVSKLLDRVENANISIVDIKTRESSLEDVFIELISDND